MAKDTSQALESPFPRALSITLVDSFLEGFDPAHETVRLSLAVQSSSMTVRQFSNYLLFLDRIYMRLSGEEPSSYGRVDNRQLRILDTRPGSLEMVIEVLDKLDPARVVLVFLAMKYLPSVVRAIPGAISDLSVAYRNYWEGTEIRRRLKSGVRKELKPDQFLESLPSRKRSQLLDMILHLYAQYPDNLRQIERFASDHQLEVKLERSDLHDEDGT